jgi:hypothetical protein
MANTCNHPLFPPDPPRDQKPGNSANSDSEPDGICEVITIPPADELSYSFELQAGQGLQVSVTSECALEILICEDDDYEDWIDSGSPTRLPERFHLYEGLEETHSLHFVPPAHGYYTVLLVNPWEEPLDAAFIAKVG